MDALQWDNANRGHIARHDVTPDEFEQILLDDPLELEAQYDGDEVRISWLGLTLRGRVLLIAFTERDGLIRPVTAYEPGAYLKRRYFEMRGGLR